MKGAFFIWFRISPAFGVFILLLSDLFQRVDTSFLMFHAYIVYHCFWSFYYHSCCGFLFLKNCRALLLLQCDNLCPNVTVFSPLKFNMTIAMVGVRSTFWHLFSINLVLLLLLSCLLNESCIFQYLCVFYCIDSFSFKTIC